MARNGIPNQQGITMVSVSNTDAPYLENFDIPEQYVVGEIFDVVFQWSQAPNMSILTPVSFIRPKPAHDDWNILDNFQFEGADLGTPNLYRKTDNVFPTERIPAELPAEWTQDGLDFITEDNKCFSWTRLPASIYLLRWNPVVSGEGVFQMNVRAGAVRWNY